MLVKYISILTFVTSCTAVYVYSSFYAPLFDRRILNYRVDAPFNPDAGRVARKQYEERYGYRGERLVADLGSGRLGDTNGGGNEVYGDVKLYIVDPLASGAGTMQQAYAPV